MKESEKRNMIMYSTSFFYDIKVSPKNNSVKEYEKLAKMMLPAITQCLPDPYKNNGLEINKVNKINGQVLIGIRLKDIPIGPQVYVNDFCDKIYSAKSIKECDEIVQSIAALLVPDKAMDMPFDVCNYNEVKKYISIKMCDPRSNEDYLKDKIVGYWKAYAYYCVIYFHPPYDNTTGTVTITSNLFNCWGISKEQLLSDALANVDAEKPILIDSLSAILMEDYSKYNLLDNSMEPNSPMMILTVTDHTYGARIVLKNGLIEEILNYLGTGFTLLPASVHEFIIVPDYVGMPQEMLLSLVSKVNRSGVSANDYLSDTIVHISNDGSTN